MDNKKYGKSIFERIIPILRQEKIIQKAVNKILRRRYASGFDESTGKDYSCKVEGYKKNSVINITKCQLTKPKDQ